MTDIQNLKEKLQSFRKKTPNSARKYPQEFKDEIVKHCKENGISVTGKNFEIPVSTLHGWIDQSQRKKSIKEIKKKNTGVNLKFKKLSNLDNITNLTNYLSDELTLILTNSNKLSMKVMTKNYLEMANLIKELTRSI